MIKRISRVCFGILCFMMVNANVLADGISIKSSASSITKGGSATVTVTVSSGTPIVTIEGSMICSGAGVSGGIDLIYEGGATDSSKTYSYTVKPTATGTVNCSISGARMTNLSSGDWIGLSSPSTSITVKAPAVVAPKTYSSNNNLKSLGIEGSEISFSKDTLEYTIEVENNITSVKINGEAEDSKASISGLGDREVVEGANKLEVIVTAENGNTKTYIVNVNVKELDPIKVLINKKEYTIVRKEGVLEAPNTSYEKTTVKIKDQEVIAYYNAKTKYTLVGLKDSSGTAKYYIYNKDKYTLYNEYTFGNTVLNILDMKKTLLPDNYVKTTFKYNDSKIAGYILENNSKDEFYLFYAMNINTGKESLYTFDSVENSVQRYNDTEISLYKDKANTYFIIIILLLGFIGLALISLLIFLILKSKKRHKTIKK